MAVNFEHIEAPPQRVFDVLSDPESYGYWVVGARKIRGADPGFPAEGTKFHHQQGFGPIRLNDDTKVLESDPPRRLVLHARFRPLGTQKVILQLTPEGAGTKVTMEEKPGDPFTRLVFNPLANLLLRGRNTEALRRLKELAEGRKRADDSQPA